MFYLRAHIWALKTYGVCYWKSEETVSINLHFFLFPPPPPFPKWTVCLCVRPSVVVLFCCSRKESLEPYYFFSRLIVFTLLLSVSHWTLHSFSSFSFFSCVCPLDWLKAQALCVAAAAVVCRWEWSINNGVRSRQMCSVLYCSVLLDRSVCKELCTLYFFLSFFVPVAAFCVAPAGDLPFSV